MIRLDALSLGAAPPEDINVLITNPKGAEPVAVRPDEISGAMIVTRLYHSTMHMPANHGLVPHTLTDNAEPLEAVVLGSHALAPGLVVAARPVGVLYVSSDGADDVTVLAVPASRLSDRYDGIKNYTDVAAAQLRQIAHFFRHFRDMEEPRAARSAGWGDVSEARRAVLEAAERKRHPVGLIDH
ncbi:MAG: inorganic diphosphatase [Pseudomonadota bacterium]